MEKALEHGSFDVRSAIGQIWEKAKKNDKMLQQRYQEVGRSYATQKAFRQKWLEIEYNIFKATKAKDEKQKISSGEYGEQKPFSVMWRDEGGDRPTLKASLNIARSQVKLMAAGKIVGWQVSVV